MTDLSGIDLYHGILPSHMKVDCWEEYARHVLSWLEPSVYSSLAIADRPDLVDASSSLGVEVTRSLAKGDAEIDALYPRYCSEANPEARKRLKGRLSQLGATVNEYMCLYPGGRDNFELIQASYKKKLQLLNQEGFELFKHNHLFIMSDILANQTMLKNALLEFEQTATNYAVSFERVIVAVPKYVYTFDLRDSSYHVAELDSGKQYELAMAARQRVLDAEQNPSY